MPQLLARLLFVLAPLKGFLACLLVLAWAAPLAAHAQAQAQFKPRGAVISVQADGAAPAASNARLPSSMDYRLGPGDSIGLMVFQNPDLSMDARVSESGVISYPLIGSVQLGGLTLPEAEKKIADGLRSGGFVRQPQVNIVLRQVRGNQVAVLGQVNRPGRFALETFNTRVSDMLAAAGGITPTGDDLLVVTGTRAGQTFRKVIDIPALFAGQQSQEDITLAAGDTLFVNKAPVYYIYGEAQKPGPYRVERGMTVMQALAAGGGPTPRGSQNRMVLHRKDVNGQVVETKPQLTDLMRPDDVIFVRESFF